MNIVDDTVIDNKEIILQDQLQKILPDTHRASIAVGYFFISGFAQIIDYFEKIKSSKRDDDIIRILISPTTDKKTAETLIEGFEHMKTIKQTIENNHLREGEEFTIIKDTKEQIKKSMEFMEQKKSDQDVTQKFIELIKTKKLQIRVYTKEKLHAKAYIFELDDSQISAIGIVGSSNLSIAGISAHSELNIKTRDPRDAIKLLEWFDDHWKNSVPFTEEIADILYYSWAGKQYKPKDVYHKAILHEHAGRFDIETKKSITRKNIIKLYDFQTLAVVDAISSLDKYDGVMISDVVGLGKTFIGSALLRYLKERDGMTSLIICPPHLEQMWYEFTEANEIDAVVLSRGKIGRNKHILSKYINTRNVILIDESHNFRNHTTNSYKELTDFMYTSQAKIILLTATPLANKLTDIKNQLKLFPGGNETKIPTGTDNCSLDSFFRPFNGDDRSLDAELHGFLKHIMIRRTRKYIVENYAKKDSDGRDYLEVGMEKKYFPKRDLKPPIVYNIDKVYQFSYEQIEASISAEKLFFARYNPGKYVLEQYKDEKKYADLINSSIGIIPLIRTSLLKRMDSSIQAFFDSITYYVKGFDLFLKTLEKGKIPIGKDSASEIYSTIHDSDYDEFEPHDMKIESHYEIEKFDVEQMKSDIGQDIKIFKEILKLLDYDFPKFDDKAEKLAEKITELIRDKPDTKILVFTESISTAQYITKYLKNNIPDIEKNLKMVNSKTKNKMKIVRRFDPVNNKGPDIPESSQISILVSTDVLSEGINLQMGKIVINYDFHWNPVKIIQRVGRVDRIGSPNDTIQIINFLPDPKLDQQLGLEESVSNKIDRIHRIIGQDYQILKSDEKLNEESLYAMYQNQDDTILNDDMVLSFEPSRFERDVSQMSDEDRTRIENMPYGIRSTVSSNHMLIACEAEHRIGDAIQPVLRRYYKVDGAGHVTTITSEILFAHLEKNSDSKSTPQQLEYNELVAHAWTKFEQDMVQASKRKMSSKSTPSELVRNLSRIIQSKSVSDPILSELFRFLNRPIYDNTLSSILKKLKQDVQTGMDDTDFIDELKSIYAIHGDSAKNMPRHVMERPRILYSMMVDV